MGAGTGPLVTGQTYSVTLNFGPGPLNQNDVLYTNFRSALAWLLEGLTSVNAYGTFSEQGDGEGNIVSLAVDVTGPLDGADRENFNRAFNRLLWSFRLRRSPDEPSASNRVVVPTDTRYRDEET